ncbi:ATP-dependent DNA ligase [Streptomyces sp. RKND-216]|uniref:non-homologous end-joining DNA ligase n=1 Tax=Streptomyces sp. RKND-216 TaxID=2562581 RepID=UPI00109DFBE0|nr:non-homologous end-joining DNA ligase [Streptomyces sp. RKND-216]THA23605.1 ATP-dependent DNA ligase [Streptomyces sp. RKND-216]
MGRTGLLELLPADQRRLLAPLADGVPPAAPMLARPSDRRDFGAGWIFERKLDGVRALAVRERGRVRLLSRTGQVMNRTYPELVDVLEEQDCEDFSVDGEIVAFTGRRTDFARLQRRMQISDPRRARATGVEVTYCLFDLLALDGVRTTGLPLRARKALLRRAFVFGPPLRQTPHRNAGGQELLDRACGWGWEGLVAKRAQGRYQTGRRSPDWLKLKCSRGQEFVVGGFTEPSGGRVGFGALLLGYHADGRLRYAGKVGTGWDRAALASLRARLDGLTRSRSPFADAVGERGAHWVEPELVAQVAFTEWTRDGMLRHPRFVGLRADKNPSEVVREEPGPSR